MKEFHRQLILNKKEFSQCKIINLFKVYFTCKMTNHKMNKCYCYDDF